MVLIFRQLFWSHVWKREISECVSNVLKYIYIYYALFLKDEILIYMETPQHLTFTKVLYHQHLCTIKMQ